MAVRILSSDLVNPELAAIVVPQERRSESRPVSVTGLGSSSGMRGLTGALQVTGILLPGITALDTRWHTGDEAVFVTDEVPSRNINIQFQVQGEMQARFTGLAHTLDMAPGRHNLIYAPEPGDETKVARCTALEMLHISIERAHFTALIGADGAWAERMHRELEADRPFSAIHGTAAVTPAMQQLIGGICRPASEESGPMQRLLVHARLLELLSLQFGQFAAAERRALPTLAPADADRLYQLKAYLDLRFLDEDLSLTDLSRRFLLNEFKLKRGFRLLFGTTVFGYLKELRMGHAAVLLRDGRQTVEEVAFTLGYEHAHHFAVAFKKQFGNSPGQWARARA